jgi:hypothetical protein
MGLLQLLVVLVVIGVLLYLVNSLIPMDGRIRTIINVIVLLFVCVWLLNAVGVFHLGTVRVDR